MNLDEVVTEVANEVITTGMGIREILITGIVSFVVAVVSSLVTFWIVNVFYAKKQTQRKDKLYIFSSLMATRDLMEKEWVRALNLINIIFDDNDKVKEAWKNYHSSLKVEKIEEWTDAKKEESRKLQIKLLESMANDNDLAYTKITWDVIDDSYYPVWLKNFEEGLQNQNKLFSQGADLIPFMTNTIKQMSNNGQKHNNNSKKGGGN